MDLCTKRLRKEYGNLKGKGAVPSAIASPLENNIHEWRFVLRGSEETDYYGGHYYGKLKFPSQYPMAPPSIMMITPSGRFACNTRICMSMSDFHPELWCPTWSVGSILTGLLSFMNSDEETTGGVVDTPEKRRAFAAASRNFNDSDKIFRELFGTSEQVERAFSDIDTRLKSTESSFSTSVIKKNETSLTAAAVSNILTTEKSNEKLEEIPTESVGSEPSVAHLSKSAKKRARTKKRILLKSDQGERTDVLIGNIEIDTSLDQLSITDPNAGTDNEVQSFAVDHVTTTADAQCSEHVA